MKIELEEKWAGTSKKIWRNGEAVSINSAHNFSPSPPNPLGKRWRGTAQARPLRQRLLRPRPAGARRAHAARRPRSRGGAPRVSESRRPPPAPEVALARLRSNSRRAEAASGAGGGWIRQCWFSDHRARWFGQDRAGQGPPSSLPRTRLGPSPPPGGGRFPEEPGRHRWVFVLPVSWGTPDPGSERDSGVCDAIPLRILLGTCRCLRRGLRSSLLLLTPVALVTEESAPARDFWGFCQSHTRPVSLEKSSAPRTCFYFFAFLTSPVPNSSTPLPETLSPEKLPKPWLGRCSLLSYILWGRCDFIEDVISFYLV